MSYYSHLEVLNVSWVPRGVYMRENTTESRVVTRKHSTNPAIPSILLHRNASAHPVNFDDFQILSSSSDSYELMIHESLVTNKYKPNLNVQSSSIPLNLF